MTPTRSISAARSDVTTKLTFWFEVQILDFLCTWHKLCIDVEFTTSASDKMAILQDEFQSRPSSQEC